MNLSFYKKNKLKTFLMMKFLTILITSIALQVSAGVKAQHVSLSVKHAPIGDVMKMIWKQSGYAFIFNQKDIRNAIPVTVEIRSMELDAALKEVFKGQPLSFSIDDKSIVVKSKPVVELAGQMQRNLQDTLMNVSGRVVDSLGRGIGGVAVQLKRGAKMTATDDQGWFELLQVPVKNSLIFSAMGFKKSELAGTANMHVLLEVNQQVMDELTVAVSTGYQSLPLERATGSFGVVTAKQLSQYPLVSLLERLQGLVPGVDVTTKTTAGKSRNAGVTIRGLSTIKSSYTRVSTDPLLVIDGFPSQTSISDGAMDYLNPDDIEQITFLKDAAASSIWGVQAANGVIVINTKKGTRNQAARISFSTTLGTSEKPRPDFGKMMSIPDYIELEKELIDKNVLKDPFLATGSYKPENNSQAQAIIFAQKRGEITEAEMNLRLTELGKIDNRQQIGDYLLQSPVTRQYNLSLSGGGANSSYYVSGFYYNEDRVYRGNKNTGYSLKASNVNSLLGGVLNLTTDLSFGNVKDRINGSAVTAMSVISNGGGAMRPYDRLVDEQGNTVYYDVLIPPHIARPLESKGYLPFSYSPIDELEYANKFNNSNNLILNVSLDAKVAPWLTANVSGNIGRIFGEVEEYWEPDSYQARMMINKATSINSNGIRVNGVPLGGRLSLANARGQSYNLRGQLNLNKTWSEKHQVNAIVGAEIRERYDKSSGELRYGYDKEINTFRMVNSGATYIDINGSSQRIGPTSQPVVEKTIRSMSQYGNASYAYDSKYIFSASARLDDNNLLGVERRKRALPLWSSGFKWNAKKEQFLSDVSWINQLGFRFTYGFNGNAPQGFAPVTVINILGNDYYTGYPTANINNPAIENLGWEKTRMTGYSVDYSLFQNRLYGAVEFYKKYTTDIIWSMPVNGTYGFSSLLFNTANLHGSGVDIGLNVVPIAKEKLRWVSTINLSYNTNEVKDTRFEKKTISFTPETLYSGYPSDYIFSFVWAGLDETGQSLIADPNEDGKVYSVMEYPFENIRTYSGRSNSPWFGSFSNSLQYKSFALDVQLQYVFGGVFRKPSVTSIGFSNNTNVGRGGDLAERWKKPGDEAYTNVPGLVFGEGANYYASLERYSQSDYLIRSRSNIRLQQIMLSYWMPEKLASKIKAQNLSISLVARNLGLLWTANEEGVDPDYIHAVGNNYQLSPVKNFSLRIGVNF